jgi:solute carrier family 25 thiamine pyrophosphate transporter 19
MNDSLVAGTVSGALTRLFTCPLDVLKIRFQLQLEPIKHSSHTSKYRGVLDSVRTILKEEGVTALWKGLFIGQIMYMVYGGAQFYTFDVCKRIASGHFPGWSNVINFGGGTVAGGVASIVSHPLDVIRTRFVGQGEPKIYPTVPKAIMMMYRENGVRCFYRGLVPSLLYIAPQTGLSFGFYHGLMQLWNYTSSHPVRAFVCGAIAGISSKTVVLPFDLIKKRLAVQGFEVARREFGRVVLYSGVIDCCRSVLREEGPLAFYKGTAPAIIKAGASVALSFMFYEWTLIWLKTRRSE